MELPVYKALSKLYDNYNPVALYYSYTLFFRSKMKNNKHKSHKMSLAWIEPDSTRKRYHDYIQSPSDPEDHTEEEQMEEMAFIEEARIVSKVNFISNFLE